MPGASPSFRGPHRVGGEKGLHPFGEVRLGSLEQEVEVVTQDDERQQLPVAAQNRALQIHQEPGPVIVVLNDVLARVSAGHDVVDGTFEFETEPAGHGRVSSDSPGKAGSPALNPGAPAMATKISHLPSLLYRLGKHGWMVPTHFGFLSGSREAILKSGRGSIPHE